MRKKNILINKNICYFYHININIKMFEIFFNYR